MPSPSRHLYPLLIELWIASVLVVFFELRIARAWGTFLGCSAMDLADEISHAHFRQSLTFVGGLWCGRLSALAFP